MVTVGSVWWGLRPAKRVVPIPTQPPRHVPPAVATPSPGPVGRSSDVVSLIPSNLQVRMLVPGLSCSPCPSIDGAITCGSCDGSMALICHQFPLA